MLYSDVIRFNPITHSSNGSEPYINFDNALVSKIELGRVDKTKLRILLKGASSRGMAYAYLKDSSQDDIFTLLLADERCLGKTLNEVLSLEVGP